MAQVATDSAMCAASRSLSNPRHRAAKPEQPEQENLRQPAGVKPAGIAVAHEQQSPQRDCPTDNEAWLSMRPVSFRNQDNYQRRIMLHSAAHRAT
jgi:hypothetical protein